jgi:putative transposase
MLWAHLLAYVTGTVNQEMVLRNEYLTAENRILRVRSRVGCCFQMEKR